MITGTNDFYSLPSAYAYYKRQGIDKAGVREKLAEGEINIGAPKVIPMNSSFHWDADGRGQIITHAQHYYIGTVTNRRGEKLFASGVHATREDAAKECFAMRPRAKTCSTSIATLQNGEWLDFGRDIRWHNKACL